MPFIYITATLGLIPIYTVASITSLILIYMLAILGIYILIKSILKVQCYSFILLDLILPVAVIFGFTLIYILAILVILICINASCIGLTPILICILAMLDIYMLIKGVLKV